MQAQAGPDDQAIQRSGVQVPRMWVYPGPNDHRTEGGITVTRMHSRLVPWHWGHSKPAKNNGYGNYHTDGFDLYSYNLKIGETINSIKILYDYSAGAGWFVSMTTSHHVSKARVYADIIMTWDVEKQEWN